MALGPMSYPFWLGNQFNFDPAAFPGYNTPQPPAPQSLFAPPPSLMGQIQGNPGQGGGQSTPNPESPPSSPMGPSFGSGKGLGMFGTAMGMAMGVPGIGILGNVLGNLADIDTANTWLGDLGANNRLSLFESINPLSASIATQYYDAQRAEDIGRDQNMMFGFDDASGSASPVGAPDGMGNFGGSDPGYDSSGGGSPGPGGGDPTGGADSGAGGGDWAKGGMVTMERLMGMNPPGPDDGYGALDAGEFVLTSGAVKNLGKETVAKLNAGEFDKKTLTKALRAKNPKVKLKKKG